MSLCSQFDYPMQKKDRYISFQCGAEAYSVYHFAKIAPLACSHHCTPLSRVSRGKRSHAYLISFSYIHYLHSW